MASTVTTFAGSSGISGNTNGTGSAARFSAPLQAVRDSSGNVYVTDSANHTIRRITPSGQVTHFAGSTTGQSGTTDGTSTAARFNTPIGIAIDNSNNLYVCDSGNHTIRRITSGGAVTTIAGRPGRIGGTNGTSLSATFNWPTGIAASTNGATLFVTDRANHTIRRITGTTTRQVITTAGLSGVPGSANGATTRARFNNPTGIVMAGSTLFVCDSSNHTIRRVSTAGATITYVGLSATLGSTNGNFRVATFNNPNGITRDSLNNLFVADTDNHAIRLVTSARTVSTFAGTVGLSGGNDGADIRASFSKPRGVLLDPVGILYVMDSSNHTIRSVITPPGTIPLMVLQTLLSRPRRVYNLRIDLIQSESYNKYNTNNDGRVSLTLFYETNQTSGESVTFTLGGNAITTTVGNTAAFTGLDQQATPHSINVAFSEFNFDMSVNIGTRILTYDGTNYTQSQTILLVNLT